jgi:hypothetical protein
MKENQNECGGDAGSWERERERERERDWDGSCALAYIPYDVWVPLPMELLYSCHRCSILSFHLNLVP